MSSWSDIKCETGRTEGYFHNFGDYSQFFCPIKNRFLDGIECFDCENNELLKIPIFNDYRDYLKWKKNNP